MPEIAHRVHEHDVAVMLVNKAVGKRSSLSTPAKAMYFNAFAGSKLWFNFQTLTAVQESHLQRLDAAIAKRAKAIAGAKWTPQAELVPDCEWLSAAGLHRARDTAAACRLKYFLRVLQWAPWELKHRLQANRSVPGSFLQLLAEDISWLRGHLPPGHPFAADMPLSELGQLMLRLPGQWKGAVARALRAASARTIDRLRHEHLHRQLSRTLQSAGLQPAEPMPQGPAE
eukprot:10331492-Lingulodinium_polyedra.AAC.1